MNMLNDQSHGCVGPQVELLQLALSRTGADILIDGIFGNNTNTALKQFQLRRGLRPSGIAGRETWNALMPHLTGYMKHTIKPGKSLYDLAAEYSTSITAIETANPNLDPISPQVGQVITIPLGFPVVPTNVRFTSTVLHLCLRGLQARYPFLHTASLGSSVMGRDISCITFGSGANHVLYNASHHANEWITTPLLMKFIEEYAHAYSIDSQLCGFNARALSELTTLYLVPMVNPDGVDLVTKELTSGEYYDQALAFSKNYPNVPFPSGWKANIDGIDLNLQYPAGWDNAQEIKSGQGITSPGPRDFVGSAPLVAPESLAMYNFTKSHNLALTLSYHTQGEVIYWKYLNYEPINSRKIAQKFGSVSGYTVEETPYASGFAGYKDWFIEEFDKPGYTVEAGCGESPLPLSQFHNIFSKNVEILTLGLSATI